MNLIHEIKFEYSLNFEGNLSTKSNIFAVVPDTIPVVDAEGNLLIQSKYIESINVNPESFRFIDCNGVETNRYFDTVTAINEMTPEQKTVVDEQEAFELRKLNDFHNKRIRFYGDSKKARDVILGFVTEALAMGFETWSGQSVTKSDKGNLADIKGTVYVGVDMLLYSDYDVLNKIQGLIIETLENDSIEAYLPDGIARKYLVPQDVSE